MRDIKFRAWNGKSFVKNAIPIRKGVYGYFEKEGYESVFKYSFKGIIEEYTGLKDRNGVEVYEGDILKVNGDTRVYSDCLFEEPSIVGFEVLSQVVYLDEIAAFDLITIESDLNMDKWGFYGEDTSQYIEVIGNVHENPELLEVK